MLSTGLELVQLVWRSLAADAEFVVAALLGCVEDLEVLQLLVPGLIVELLEDDLQLLACVVEVGFSGKSFC